MALRCAPEAFGSTLAREMGRSVAADVERLGGGPVFGAYRAGAIVGMLGLRRIEGPQEDHKGMLWGFFVAAECRRSGVGLALMRAALAAAADMVEQVHLTVVTENAGAIALYERLGFVRYGVEPRALRGSNGVYRDEALMVLRFAPPGAVA